MRFCASEGEMRPEKGGWQRFFPSLGARRRLARVRDLILVPLLGSLQDGEPSRTTNPMPNSLARRPPPETHSRASRGGACAAACQLLRQTCESVSVRGTWRTRTCANNDSRRILELGPMRCTPQASPGGNCCASRE